jgi:DNA-binding response OmpR family regulator
MIETAPLRILVVEDEAMIALYIEDCLISFGHQVVGPVARVEKALAMIENEKFNLALLDVNVADEEIYPAAVELRIRGIPFIFLSGYGSMGLREAWKGSPVLEKPFAPQILQARIDSIMQQA